MPNPLVDGVDIEFVRIRALARIRAMRGQGKTYREIGDFYGIADTTAMRANKRQTVLKLETCRKILDRPYQYRLL